MKRDPSYRQALRESLTAPDDVIDGKVQVLSQIGDAADLPAAKSPAELQVLRVPAPAKQTARAELNAALLAGDAETQTETGLDPDRMLFRVAQYGVLASAQHTTAELLAGTGAGIQALSISEHLLQDQVRTWLREELAGSDVAPTPRQVAIKRVFGEVLDLIDTQTAQAAQGKTQLANLRDLWQGEVDDAQVQVLLQETLEELRAGEKPDPQKEAQAARHYAKNQGAKPPLPGNRRHPGR